MVSVIRARPVKHEGAGHASKGIGGRSLGTDQGFGSRQGNGSRVDGTRQPSFRGRGFAMTLSQLIEDSEKLINWLDRQIDDLDVQADWRHRAAAGCLDLSMEYQKAIVLLVAKKIYGPAFSLMRLIVESYVRGIWLHRCATEKDLEKFAKDKVPDFYKLLEDIEKLESHEDKVLSRMKERSWKIMNSYTHTGYHQVVRRQTEISIEANYDDDEILELVNFANAIGYLAAIATCDLANNAELAATILDKIKSERQ